jgi:hypothetical protein
VSIGEDMRQGNTSERNIEQNWAFWELLVIQQAISFILLFWIKPICAGSYASCGVTVGITRVKW